MGHSRVQTPFPTTSMAHEGHHMHHMPMAEARCKMNMLWYANLHSINWTKPPILLSRNSDIIDTCIVFRTWHVTSNSYFVGSCIAIVLLGILYEYLRVFQQKLDYQIASSLQTKGKGRSSSRGSSGRNSPVEESGLLTGRKILKTGTGWVWQESCKFASSITHYKHRPSRTPVPAISRVLRALVYGVTVFLSFFLMLVFMTYNVRSHFVIISFSHETL